MLRSSRKTLTLAIAATLTLAPPAFGAGDKALEEVIVTARKREENLQNVPTAINVLTADQLKDRQIENLADMQSTTSNITMTESGGLQSGSLTVFIRGIGNDPGFGQGIGVYLNDVYLPTQVGLMMDVFDVERIEILKGPQGNLYGRNTIGGAIKYITREPDDVFRVDVDAKVGSYALRQVKGSVSGPLVDGLVYGGVGLAYRKHDGYQTNIYDGKKFNAPDSRAARADLKITPLDNFTISLMGNFTDDVGTPSIPTRLATDPAQLLAQYQAAIASGALPAGAPPSDTTQYQSPDKVNTSYDFSNFRIITRTLAATLKWDIDDNMTLKSVTAERDQVNTAPYDFGTSDQTFINNKNHVKDRNFSQEFQFNYSGDWVDAVAGVYYSNGTTNTPGLTYLGPRFPIPAVVYDPTVGPTYTVLSRWTDTTKDWHQIKSTAYYGNADFDLTDDWHFSIGARYTIDRRSIERDATFSGQAWFYRPGAPAVGQPAVIGPLPYGYFASTDSSFPLTSAHWNNFSPTFKLSYDVNPDTMVYASVASGYKAGDFNTTSTVLGVVAPEKVRTYAIGLKTTLADNRLRLNTELFYNDYTDKQLSIITFTNGQLTNAVDNVGKAHTQGVDFESTWVTPIDGLRIDLNVGYLDAKMDKYTTVDAVTQQSIDAADYTSLGFSPRWTVGARASYDLSVGDWGNLTFAGDAAYRAKAYTNSPVNRNNALAATQLAPEFTLYNASILFKTPDEHWRVSLEGKNLTNRRVITSTYSVTPFIDAGYNAPRTWALGVGYSY